MMTRDTLFELLLRERFGREFVRQTAARIAEKGAWSLIYDTATAPHTELPAAVRHRLLLRSAWVLENLWSAHPAHFAPFADRFCRVDFSACTDASARRCMTKIMTSLLRSNLPEPQLLDRIAESAAAWAVEPAAKPAVRIGCVEILKRVRGRVAWVDGLWDDLIETLGADAPPSIAVRMRKSWRKP